ncbi:hypothetical protein GQ53DRAFT_752069 [Thozetella sp. PMI_491]|nr:hypothetical protein GQ53DRAFT_752069 [Thozetella sp. PMI_491]
MLLQAETSAGEDQHGPHVCVRPHAHRPPDQSSSANVASFLVLIDAGASPRHPWDHISEGGGAAAVGRHMRTGGRSPIVDVCLIALAIRRLQGLREHDSAICEPAVPLACQALKNVSPLPTPYRSQTGAEGPDRSRPSALHNARRAGRRRASCASKGVQLPMGSSPRPRPPRSEGQMCQTVDIGKPRTSARFNMV